MQKGSGLVNHRSNTTPPAAVTDLILAAADIIADPPVRTLPPRAPGGFLPLRQALDRAALHNGDEPHTSETRALLAAAEALVRECAASLETWDHGTRWLAPQYRAQLLRDLVAPATPQPQAAPGGLRITFVDDHTTWASRRRPAEATS